MIRSTAPQPLGHTAHRQADSSLTSKRLKQSIRARNKTALITLSLYFHIKVLKTILEKTYVDNRVFDTEMLPLDKK